MSSAEPTPPRGAEAPGAASDQSMEDILASIRRILNEEDQPAQAAAPVAEPAPEPEDDALLLTEEMMVPAPEDTPSPAAIEEPAAPEPMAIPVEPVQPIEEPPPVMVVADPEPEPEPSMVSDPLPEPVPEEPVQVPPPVPAQESLLAPAVAAAATMAIGNLLRTVSQERNLAVRSGGPSIEDLVREEMRPLLKDWLDQHLPGIVERLVRAEIERVVGRALS